MSKRKTLKQTYHLDPEAAEFLKKYPEFDDRFIEGDLNPQWDTSKGRFTTTDVRDDQKQYGEMMLTALRYLPEGSEQRMLLEAYFLENFSIPQLKALLGVNSSEAARARIFRAKRAALKAMLSSRKLDINGLEPEAIRTFVYLNAPKLVFLVRPVSTSDAFWVLEDGTRLPENVQDILDSDPELKEWDLIVLK